MSSVGHLLEQSQEGLRFVLQNVSIRIGGPERGIPTTSNSDWMLNKFNIKLTNSFGCFWNLSLLAVAPEHESEFLHSIFTIVYGSVQTLSTRTPGQFLKVLRSLRVYRKRSWRVRSKLIMILWPVRWYWDRCVTGTDRDNYDSGGKQGFLASKKVKF